MRCGTAAATVLLAFCYSASYISAQNTSLGSVGTGSPGTVTIISGSATPADINLRPFLFPNPRRPTCSVNASVFLRSSYISPAYRARQPTASPVPTYVLGAINFRVSNLNKTAIKPNWTLSVEVADDVNFTDVRNARIGRTRYNSTEGDKRIPLTTLRSNQTLLAGHANNISIAVLINATSQSFTPTATYLNGEQCSLTLTVNVSALVPGLPIPANFSIIEAAGAITASNGRLFGVDGRPVQLRGANWFGFETQSTTVDGIYEGDSTITGDFATVAYRLTLLGFNALRIPFSFQVLFNMQPVSYTRACSTTTPAQLLENATPPGTTVPAGTTPPEIAAPPRGYADGQCNSYLPNDSVYTRFLYVIRYYTRNGFYIILDNQLNLDTTAVDNPTKWVELWTQVMTDVTSDSITAGRVMVDILNEPDSQKIRWDASNGNQGATTYYLNAMDALYKVNSATLFLVEGTGQQSSGAICWGDGFVIDQDYLDKYGGSSPVTFFNELLTRPYLENVVIAPHYYGPSISKATSGYSGEALVQSATRSWGYLNKAPGYCGPDGNCHVFPIIIGETGSQVQSAEDAAFYDTLVQYLQVEGVGDDGKHNPIPHVFWWAWNANSGDTGGIVDATWTQILWRKITLISRLNGLVPYATLAAAGNTTSPSPSPSLPITAPPPSPTTSPSPSPSPSPEAESPSPSPEAESPSPSPASPSPSPAASPSPDTESPSPSPAASPSPDTESPSPSPTALPAPVASPEPSPSPAGNGGSTAPAARVPCGASYKLGGQVFTTEGVPTLDINVYLHGASPAGGPTIFSPYTVVVCNPDYFDTVDTWNWNVGLGRAGGGCITGRVVSGTLVPNYENFWNPGFTVTIPGAGRTADFAPTSISVNGEQCQIST